MIEPFSIQHCIVVPPNNYILTEDAITSDVKVLNEMDPFEEGNCPNHGRQ